MAVRAPDVTTGAVGAGVALVVQLIPGLDDEQRQNATNLGLALVATDALVRLGRQKYIAKLLADRDKSGIPDLIERPAIIWAIVATAVAVGLGIWLILELT